MTAAKKNTIATPVKRRGRKPKVEADDSVEKKRGRKPKQKTYSVKDITMKTVVNDTEHIILHFPFSVKDVYSNDPFNTCNEKNLLEYNPSITEPQPFEPESLQNFSLLEQEGKKKEVSSQTKDILSYIKPMEEVKEVQSPSNKPKVESNNYLNTDIYIQNNISPYTNNDKVIMRKNLNNILYEFIDSNETGVWPESTNIYCRWCCHPFDGPPCAIPVKYEDGKFYVTGCFCSFNCAAAYNFKDYKLSEVWERYSLLNLLYKKIYNKPFVKIKPAPPREVLTIFGGYLNIDDYRKNFLRNDREYKVIMPPIVSIVPKIEENIIEFNNNQPIPVDKEKINSAVEKLRLKRNKPLAKTTQTLENFMDMTYL